MGNQLNRKNGSPAQTVAVIAVLAIILIGGAVALTQYDKQHSTNTNASAQTDSDQPQDRISDQMVKLADLPPVSLKKQSQELGIDQGDTGISAVATVKNRPPVNEGQQSWFVNLDIRNTSKVNTGPIILTLVFEDGRKLKCKPYTGFRDDFSFMPTVANSKDTALLPGQRTMIYYFADDPAPKSGKGPAKASIECDFGTYEVFIDD